MVAVTGCVTIEANPKTAIGAVGGATLGGLIAGAAHANAVAIAASVSRRPSVVRNTDPASSPGSLARRQRAAGGHGIRLNPHVCGMLSRRIRG
jgi:hypothetical protein